MKMNKFVSATMLRQKFGKKSPFERPVYLTETSKRSIASTATVSIAEDLHQDFPELFESCLNLVQSITAENQRVSKAVMFSETALEQTIPHLSRDDYTEDEKRACFVSSKERKLAYSQAQATSKLAVAGSTMSEHPLQSVCSQAAKIAWAVNRTSKNCDEMASKLCQKDGAQASVEALAKWLDLQNEEFRGLEKFIRNVEFQGQQQDARNREMMQSRQRIVHASKERLSSATIAALCKRLTCSDVVVARLLALCDAMIVATE
jgi:hypothetical protein